MKEVCTRAEFLQTIYPRPDKCVQNVVLRDDSLRAASVVSNYDEPLSTDVLWGIDPPILTLWLDFTSDARWSFLLQLIPLTQDTNSVDSSLIRYIVASMSDIDDDKFWTCWEELPSDIATLISVWLDVLIQDLNQAEPFISAKRNIDDLRMGVIKRSVICL